MELHIVLGKGVDDYLWR